MEHMKYAFTEPRIQFPNKNETRRHLDQRMFSDEDMCREDRMIRF
jgi:hypothetical protein